MDYEKTSTGAPKKRFFIGLGWEKNGYLNMALRKEDIEKLPVNDRGYVRITAKAHAQPSEKTHATHWVAADDYDYSQKKVSEEAF